MRGRVAGVAAAIATFVAASIAACNALTGSGDFSTVEDCTSCRNLCGSSADCVEQHCASLCAGGETDSSIEAGDAPVESAIDTGVDTIDSHAETITETAPETIAETVAETVADTVAETISETSSDSTTDAADSTVDSVASDTSIGDTPDSSSEADAACTGDLAPVSSTTCSSSRGPVMARITFGATWCIDTTEVTIGQYKAFLSDRSGSTCGQPSFCSWNTTYAPAITPSTDVNMPITDIDWCDAYMFCRWAGKHLCGQTSGAGGGALPASSLNTFDDQWYFACGDGSLAHTYPYGDTYTSGTCNDSGGTPPSTGILDVGSKTSCKGTLAPFNTMFDMSGNVGEWQDSCDSSGGADPSLDLCQKRGGNNVSNSSECRCDSLAPRARSSTSSDRGVRCCAG